MPFPVPAYSSIDADIAADLRRLPNADPALRVGLLPVLRMVLGRLAAGEYAYLSKLPDRALMPDSVEGNYLDRQASNVGLSRLQPTPSVGSVQFTGTADIPIASGAQMQDGTGTVTLATTAAATIGVDGTVVVPVASISTGTAANLAAGAPVTLLVGVAGISATGTVQPAAGADPTIGLTGGTDIETDADFHVRFKARRSKPPQGGASYDFESWAKSVNGVTRVFVYPLHLGPGTVSITFLMDGRADPVPLAADVATVQAAIDARAPVVGVYTAFAATKLTEAVTITGLAAATGYTLAQAEANATAAIAALNYTTIPGGTLYLEQVDQAIANAAGVATFDLTAPAADIAAGFGELVQLSPPSFA